MLWAEKLRELSRADMKVTKDNFISVYASVRDHAFSRDNVLAAWRATGIWPFDRNAIEQEQLAPANLTSTETFGPVSLPAELRDICEALRLQKRVDHNDHGDHCLTRELPAPLFAKAEHSALEIASHMTTPQ